MNVGRPLFPFAILQEGKYHAIVIYNQYLYTVNLRISVFMAAALMALAAIYKVKGQGKACALYLVRFLGQRTDEPHELTLVIANNYETVSLRSLSTP